MTCRHRAGPRRTLAVAVAVTAASLSACAAGTAATAPDAARPEAPAAPLPEGCRAGRVDRVTWRVHCPGLVAELHDPYGEPDEALLAEARERAGLAGGGAAAGEAAAVPLAGADRRALRLRVASPGDPARARAGGVAATIPFGEERTRVVWCVAAASVPAARCDEVVARLATLPWRPALPAAPLPPELAGRPVLVPAGCEAVAQPFGGTISCSGTDSWSWRLLGLRKDVAPSDLEYADSAADAAKMPRPATEPVPEPPKGGRPCLLDGVETRCAVREAWGGASASVTAVATVRGRPLEATCTFFGGPDELPEMCDGLEWKR